MKGPWVGVHAPKLDSLASTSQVCSFLAFTSHGSWKMCQDLAILPAVLTSCLRVLRPSRLSSPPLIALGPIGSAAFNNEFGRPCITGYFRTFLAKIPLCDGSEELRG